MSYISVKPKDKLTSFLRTRPKTSITSKIKNEINMVTFDKRSGSANVYGSFSYILQKYAADIDLYEIYYPKGTEDSAIRKFEKKLLDVVHDIIKKRNHWFSEYKTGYDMRYDIDIGQMKDGNYHINPNLMKISKKMYKDKLFNKQELSLIEKSINIAHQHSNSADAYDVINNIFRERKVLRWTSQEILQRYKKLPANKQISLFEALHMKAHVKIDEIINLNGKFIEITNYVFLGHVDRPGHEVPINIPLIDDNIVINGLKAEIEKLYLSNFYYSPFKVVKRIFALSRFVYLHKNNKKYAQYLDKIIPFVSSDVSFLYQMKAELEAILRIFIVSKSLPITGINNQIDELKIGLSNIIELEQKEIQFLNKLIDNIIHTSSRKKKYDLIKKLIDKLKHFINYLTVNYLDKINFNPPPDELYPKNMKYLLIERTPLSDPQKHSKLIQLYKKL